jgi:Tfp pilus assembly protein PilN
MIEVGAAVLRWQTYRRVAQVKQQAPIVEQIDTAQALANRIGELSEKRLMPFEMLSEINPSRPDSVVFQRTVTRGLRGIEIEAQAGNAEDVSTYTTALKALPALAEVKTREVRSRDGVTSFVLAIEFKADAFRKGGSQ